MPVSLQAVMAAQRPTRSRRLKSRRVLLRPIKGRFADEMLYRNDLMLVVNLLKLRTKEILFPLLEALEPQYRPSLDSLTTDGPSDQLRAAMQGMRADLGELETYATAKAQGLVRRMDRAHSIRFFKQVQQRTGVDLKGVVEREGLEEVLRSKVNQNVDLIQKLPAEYFSKLENLVYENTIGGRLTAKSLQKEIGKLWEQTAAHAKFIARDQTAKLNSAINTARNLSLGIETYEWRATGGKAGDGRTRKTHRDHHEEIYRFGSRPGEAGYPPDNTGHPGEDFQCRCTARSIIPGV